MSAAARTSTTTSPGSGAGTVTAVQAGPSSATASAKGWPWRVAGRRSVIRGTKRPPAVSTTSSSSVSASSSAHTSASVAPRATATLRTLSRGFSLVRVRAWAQAAAGTGCSGTAVRSPPVSTQAPAPHGSPATPGRR
ncbi:hypothetical protein SAZ11_54415 [Streptomyces sp. FXJ1.4098]|nr:hypothetical protein [Streptomyces sp. FXJ1.4098]